MSTHRRPGIIDLVALLIIVAGPITLVIVGKADAATIVIVGEFIVGVLAVWFYQQRVTDRASQSQAPASAPSERLAIVGNAAQEGESQTSEVPTDPDHESTATDTSLG